MAAACYMYETRTTTVTRPAWPSACTGPRPDTTSPLFTDSSMGRNKFLLKHLVIKTSDKNKNDVSTAPRSFSS